jgi:hypothetical protein
MRNDAASTAAPNAIQPAAPTTSARKLGSAPDFTCCAPRPEIGI